MSLIAVSPFWQLSERSSRSSVVIDVLRWSTVVVASLIHGAKRVEAHAEPADAARRASALGRDHTILGGERNNRPLPGFDLGNSPIEYSSQRVAGKVVITSTTNGTSALVAARASEVAYVGAFVNLQATVDALTHHLRRGEQVSIICAGQAGSETLEDTCCAGAIVDRLLEAGTVAETDLDAMAKRALDSWLFFERDIARVMSASPHATALRDDGFEDDVLYAAQVDALPCVALRQPMLGSRHTEHPHSIVMHRT